MVSSSMMGAPRIASYDKEKWGEFVTNSGSLDTMVHEYYLGKPIAEGQGFMISDEDRKKVIVELFTDAVDMGSIVLSNPYASEDFEFSIRPEGAYGRRSVNISLKKDPSVTQVFFYSLEPRCSMGRSDVDWTFGKIRDGINNLFAK